MSFLQVLGTMKIKLCKRGQELSHPMGGQSLLFAGKMPEMRIMETPGWEGTNTFPDLWRESKAGQNRRGKQRSCLKLFSFLFNYHSQSQNDPY